MNEREPDGPAVAPGSPVRRAVLPVLVISATLLAAADSMALPPFPLVLTVVGRGAIHVRVAEGRVAPCDSFSDRPVLDQWLRAGTSQTFSINDACVCVDHTWGSFREREWSPGRVICGASPSRRSPLPNPVERLVISTDQP